MKSKYKALTQVALSALLCVSLTIPASAQRGAQQAQQNGGGSSGGGGGGSAQPQRSSPPPAPAPQPQFQRSSPPPAPAPTPAPQPQFQRSAPQPQPAPQQQPVSVPQQQPQIQRGSPQVSQPVYTPQPQQVQQSQPQMQRNNPPQGNNSYGVGQPRPNAAPSVGSVPRGGEHAAPLIFKPNNPGSTSRLYPNGGQRGSNGQRGDAYNNGFNFRRNNNTAYRSYPGLRLGRYYASPRPRGFYYNNRGYYNTYYTPQLGYNTTVLPYGYYQFYYGNDQYYYSDGLYYTQQEDESNYTVVEPPIGAIITKLPPKAQSIVINGVQYYEQNGVYYLPITDDKGKVSYQIAGKDGELNTAEDTGIAPEDLPQVGDLVDHLPAGFKILKLNGKRYYVSQEGYYFQDDEDTNGDKVFKIVGTPYDTIEN